MSKEQSRYRWFVVVVFFFFMLLHQTDKLMIGSMQVQISEDFQTQQQAMGTDQLRRVVVATVLYPDLGLFI